MKRAYTLIELAVVLSILGILFAILYPVFMRSKENAHYSSCRSNLKQIGLGLLQYVQDYDEKLPPSATSIAGLDGAPPPFGWAGLIQPYVRSTQLLQCTSEPNPSSGDARKSGFTDYWLNARLAGRSQNRLAEPASVFLCGDGNDGTDLTDARYSLAAWPQAWSRDDSLVLRHNGTANFLYADGHVKVRPLPQILNSRAFVPRFENPNPPRKYLKRAK